MKRKVIAAALVCMAAMTAGIGSGARAETVDLLLVLAADVSRSIDDDEFNLQRKGYAAAITDPQVLRAITGGRHNAIAVTFVEWSGAAEQTVVIDWTVVRDEEGAAAIAATMRSAPRSSVGRTAIGSAIDFGVQRLQEAPARAERRVIDVSGDGTSNSGRSLTEARDEAVATGITINGLAIANNRSTPGYAFHTQPPGGLPKYFRENVIGGAGAFLITVEDFHSFADAITRKLVAEIAGTSDPGSSRRAGLP
ncbi:MAG: DUF1194 domain-containing protein [Alphaproteobacteria bacterium]